MRFDRWLRDQLPFPNLESLKSQISRDVATTRRCAAAWYTRTMLEYHSNITLIDAAAMLLRHKRLVVTTHAKPDGDAFGSVVALSTALRNVGVDVQPFFMPPGPPHHSASSADIPR